LESASTGIEAIDRLLGGAMVRGKVYLLEADNGTQPHGLIYPFIKEGLKKNELIICASNERPADEVLSNLKEYAIPVEEAIQNKQLVVLDLWSEGEATEQGIIFVGNPSDPHKVLYSFQQVHNFMNSRTPQIPVRVVLDSLSGLVMTFGFERAYRLASRVVRLLKLGTSVGLAVVVPGMHPPIVAESFEHLYDGVIRLILEEEHNRLLRFLRIVKSPTPGFEGSKVPYEVTPTGFELSVDLIEAPPMVQANLNMLTQGVLTLFDEHIMVTPASIVTTLLRNLSLSYDIESLIPVLHASAQEALHQTIPKLLEQFVNLEPNAKIGGFAKFVSLLGLGQMQISFDTTDEEYNIILEHSPIGENLKELGLAIDFIHSAMIANLLEAVWGHPYICEEILCVAKGDPHCEFRAYPAKKRK
jgi:KaiC/GvpD/RAD55 family RecA-like ATPase